MTETVEFNYWPILIGVAIASLISIFISKAIMSWANEIKYRNRLMEVQVFLLAEIAKKQDVPAYDIAKLFKYLKKKGVDKYSWSGSQENKDGEDKKTE